MMNVRRSSQSASLAAYLGYQCNALPSIGELRHFIVPQGIRDNRHWSHVNRFRGAKTGSPLTSRTFFSSFVLFQSFLRVPFSVRLSEGKLRLYLESQIYLIALTSRNLLRERFTRIRWKIEDPRARDSLWVAARRPKDNRDNRCFWENGSPTRRRQGKREGSDDANFSVI